MPLRPHNPIARRSFLKQSAVAAGVVGAASKAVARTGRVLGANDRIRIGLIGCGGLGQAYHIPRLQRYSEDKSLNVELAAICDIYDPRKQEARARTGADLYHDYRDMLAREDIDAVIVCTPDHWHSQMTLDALDAGKDVHVEKPMTLYWEQAKKICEKAQKLGRIVQVGAEGSSYDTYWQARRVIASGRIGKVVWASGGVYRNTPWGDWNVMIDPRCTPKTLDWERFLGPAPRRPFDPDRYFAYRKYWDYSGGLAHDLLAHVLSALMVCLGPEFPHRVSAAGGVYIHTDREVPDTFHMMIEYHSQWVATLFTTQTTRSGVGTVIRGDHGTVEFARDQDHEHEVIVAPDPTYPDAFDEFRIPSQPRPEHEVNFIQCLRTRERPICDATVGYRVIVALDLGVRSWREGKMFTFDAENERIVAGG